MYSRILAPQIQSALEKYSLVLLSGPRQSGKTTLARQLFPEFKYLLLEDLDLRQQATDDPRGFLKQHAGSLILDEVQQVPGLLSYLQGIVDDPQNTRRFILTGSQNLLLMEAVSQTLAGRIRVFQLLPLSQKELLQKDAHRHETLEGRLYQGGYPRIFDRSLNPSEWLAQYYLTYVERDVRSLAAIGDLDLFHRFVRLLAGRVGQLINYSSLASDCGVSQPTVRSWVSVLKASFVCFTLEPHFRNFNKRLIKTPKLYFYDTGLLCYLLRVQRPEQLESHPLRGAIFENFVITEMLKNELNQGRDAPFYFWRDQKGHEVDLALDQGTFLDPIEIKSAATFHPSFMDGIRYLNSLQNYSRGTVIYGGDTSLSYQEAEVKSWREL